MSRICIIVFSIMLPLVALAQDVVKVNILELAGKIPTPPADVKEASQRSGSYYTPIVDRLNSTRKEIERNVMTLSQPSMDVAKGMDAKEMRKKMKSMSKEEKIKMAMEISKGMTPKAMALESNDVMAAQDECRTVTAKVGDDIQNAQEVYQRRGKLVENRDRKHKEIEAWTETETQKLPQINYGEMSGPEPKAHHALRVKSMDKHLAAENEYLKGMAKEWKRTYDAYTARYGSLQKKLIIIDHGEAAKNSETRRQILNAQGLMLSGTDDLVKLSRDATDHARAWWAWKLTLDKEKP